MSLDHTLTKPVRAPKLPHIIAQRLRSQIAIGELRPGDTLPSEAELLKEFGISRPTLREALRVLESETLIQLGRGSRSGATILAPSVEMAAQYGSLYLALHDTTLGQIHEVRSILEPPLAALLAKKSRRKTIQTLESCVQSQREALEQRDHIAAVAAVNDFHDHLVRSSDNMALRLLAGMVREISANVYSQMPTAPGRATKAKIWRRTEQSSDAHKSLVAIIKSKEPAKAERFWRSYMEDTAEFLRKVGLSNLRVKVPTSI